MTSEPRRWSEHPLIQLTLVRYREFFREPEAVFWVFVFPVLLTAGLGVAFRNQPPARTPVAVVAAAPGWDSLGAVLAASPALTVQTLDDSAAAQALRTGRVALVVVPRETGEVEFHFDRGRPDGRTARLLADAAVQAAAGRRNPVEVTERL